MSELRQRRGLFKKIKELDAFSKVPDTYVETTKSGGIISLVCFMAIAALVVDEIMFFQHSEFKFHVTPDQEYNEKITINIDMVVAMPCYAVGADVLDATNDNMLSFGELEEEDTWFELSPQQRTHLGSIQILNTYLREQYHSLSKILWKSGWSKAYTSMPKREDDPHRPHDACRMWGSLQVNKVAGNFHVIAGKSVPLPRGHHAHLNVLFDLPKYNFSHRIYHFSFGDLSPGVIYPLDGDEKITEEETMLYQYFIKVVPTDVHTIRTRLQTCQFSVKEQERKVDHNNGSHGMPGIHFKYDMAAFKVTVTEGHEGLINFIVRLCGIIGGVFATSHFLNNLVTCIVRWISNRKRKCSSGNGRPLCDS